MILRIDQASPDPIYLQIRNQIVEGIARGELVAGDSLPSVRALASDLGINLHTVNKAYAVLRDEGYVAMRGRSGAFIARPAAASSPLHATLARQRVAQGLRALAVEYKAAGGDEQVFLDEAARQARRVFRPSGPDGARGRTSVEAKDGTGENARQAPDAKS